MKLVLGQLRFVYVSQEQREPPNYFEMVADCNRFIHSVDLAQRTVLFLDIAGTEACHKNANVSTVSYQQDSVGFLIQLTKDVLG